MQNISNKVNLKHYKYHKNIIYVTRNLTKKNILINNIIIRHIFKIKNELVI